MSVSYRHIKFMSPGPAEPRLPRCSVDPDLTCTVWYLVCEFVSTTWITQADWLTIRNGHGILIYAA